MTFRKSFLAEPYYRWLDKRILSYVNRLTLNPNQFTLVGVLLAAAVPIGFFLHPVVGLLFMLISGFADTEDRPIQCQILDVLKRQQFKISQYFK